jgi:glucose-6-phosphate isomerase
MSKSNAWKRLQFRSFIDTSHGYFALDYSRIGFDDSLFSHLSDKCAAAMRNIKEIESGSLANPDEKRMVGHYWLRSPDRAPSLEIAEAITSSVDDIKHFVRGLAEEDRFTHALIIGIGGSALGPQFVSQALGKKSRGLVLTFMDNTDPDGMARVVHALPLATTLGVVISKSGGTKETRNGMLVFQAALKAEGLSPREHLVAVTSEGSQLDEYAKEQGWRARFPLWDWVGGRTSQLSPVGLLPAALEDIDIDALLNGARHMDALTRDEMPRHNPAMILALSWFHASHGRGSKDMVVLPYKDRLELLSRYLQQLVMESLGKEKDLDGAIVNQGLSVYGNKGSTDQHAFIQQLRDGVPNFFVLFIEVLRDIAPATGANALGLERFAIEENDITCGDYLHGFLQGTREALFAKGRESVTITIDEVNEFFIGALIALFERAVSFYASFINVNAYHQPGVEAGKKAATEVIELQKKLLEELKKADSPLTVDELCSSAHIPDECERAFLILRHLAANGRVTVTRGDSAHFTDKYSLG